MTEIPKVAWWAFAIRVATGVLRLPVVIVGVVIGATTSPETGWWIAIIGFAIGIVNCVSRYVLRKPHRRANPDGSAIGGMCVRPDLGS
jgi:hypothetical protein